MRELKATRESETRLQATVRTAGTLLKSEMLSFEGAALPTAISLVGFRGHDALSQPYAFDVVFTASASGEISMEEVVGSRAALTVGVGGGVPARIHGILAEIELADVLGESAIYRAKLVPELWHLSHSVHSRIYTEVTVPEILRAVLGAAGITGDMVELRLFETYAVLEHVCQYKESDLDFISRLMEKFGLYYFFDHRGERETMVIADHAEGHGEFDSGEARYVGWTHDETGPRPAGVDRWSCKMSALPANVRLTDYDPLRPQILPRGDAMVSGGRGSVVLYGENIKSQAEGQKLARVRAQELSAKETVFQGAATSVALQSGHRFELVDHPNRELERGYLVVGVDHFGRSRDHGDLARRMLGGTGEESYRVEVRAIPDDVQYRAPRLTPRPRIDGTVDGIIDGGADSSYAQIDEHGRYRVRIFFDESDLVDGSRSTWVRMLQPHGGGVEGMHFPLRKGTEVHMAFLGGDPDRPVIIGTAPNAHKPSKITSSNGTQNVLRSGANNQLVMEDAGGGEHVLLSSPNQSSFLHMGAGGSNFVASTAGSSLHNTGGDHVGTIGGAANETVGGAVAQSYGATHDLSVAGAATHQVGGPLDHSVGGAVTQSFGATHALSVAGAATHGYAATLDVTVGAAHTESIGASSMTAIGADQSVAVGASQTVTVGAAYALSVGGATTEDHAGAKTTTIGGAHTVSAAGAQVIEGLGSQTVHGASQQIISDGAQVLASSTHTVETGVSQTHAGTIALEAGESATISAAEVTIQAGAFGVSSGPFGVSASDVSIDAGAVHVAGGGIVEISAGVIRLN